MLEVVALVGGLVVYLLTGRRGTRVNEYDTVLSAEERVQSLIAASVLIVLAYFLFGVVGIGDSRAGKVLGGLIGIPMLFFMWDAVVGRHSSD